MLKRFINAKAPLKAMEKEQHLQTRSPICVMMGHVDHGKSSLLDAIRKTHIVSKEAGGITQSIGASLVPIDVAANICRRVFGEVNKIKCPGILFVDTPGHAAFTTLRARGGNIADIAVLVVDINDGFMPQTYECINILKKFRTPFVVACNKLDTIAGYKKKSENVIESIESQPEDVRARINKAIYRIVGSLYESGFNSERFDRVKDFTKEVSIIPTSAASGEGIAELLMVIMGLAQRFLESNLTLHPDNPGKGIVLEVKEDKSLGKSIDVILYDGHLKVNDMIVLGGMRGPIVTKVKGILVPAPLAEIRDKKTKFKGVKEVTAAMGIKILAPLLNEAMAGTPLYATNQDPASIEENKKKVMKEISDVFIETEKLGVIIKADSLGSLEGIASLAKERDIAIRKALVGDITKKDLIEADSVANEAPELGVIFGFNVGLRCNPKEIGSKAKVFLSDVIYSILEDYEKWRDELLERKKREKLENLPSICRFVYLQNHTFRQSNPAIIGVEVLAGNLTKNSKVLRKDGVVVGEIKSIQVENKSVDSIKKNERAAVAIEDAVCNRKISEGEEYYIKIEEEDYRRFKELGDILSDDEKEVLKEIAALMRNKDPMWGL